MFVRLASLSLSWFSLAANAARETRGTKDSPEPRFSGVDD